MLRRPAARNALPKERQPKDLKSFCSSSRTSRACRAFLFSFSWWRPLTRPRRHRENREDTSPHFHPRSHSHASLPDGRVDVHVAFPVLKRSSALSRRRAFEPRALWHKPDGPFCISTSSIGKSAGNTGQGGRERQAASQPARSDPQTAPIPRLFASRFGRKIHLARRRNLSPLTFHGDVRRGRAARRNPTRPEDH